MTPTPGSATPEGKPTAREVARKLAHSIRPAQMGTCVYIADNRPHGMWCDRVTQELTAAIEQDRARRDALHAETLRREVQAQATSDAGSFAAERAELQRLVADARAALQRGEEREKVMLATLRSIGFDVRGEVTWCGSCGDLVDVCDADIERGGNCDGWEARRALATAQAMKEGSG